MRPLAVLLVLALACAAPSHSARENPSDARTSDSQPSARAGSPASVDGEVGPARFTPPRWAGTFSRSQPHGSTSISVAPESGVTVSATFPGGAAPGRGAIRACGATWFEVELEPDDERWRDTFGEPLFAPPPWSVTRFHLVPWERLEFLVPEHRMLAFCDAFNVLGSSRALCD